MDTMRNSVGIKLVIIFAGLRILTLVGIGVGLMKKKLNGTGVTELV